MTKDKYMNAISNDFMMKEEQQINRIAELSMQLDEKTMNFKGFIEQYEKMEKEYSDMVYNIFKLTIRK
jgi:hypothetical protein